MLAVAQFVAVLVLMATGSSPAIIGWLGDAAVVLYESSLTFLFLSTYFKLIDKI
mgnify:CR=1 FL=1